MVHRTSERELSELAERASNCIEHTGHSIGVGYSYGHTDIELRKHGESGISRLESGLTMREAAQWLSAFAQGCHYGKKNLPNPDWKWREK
jgi:hypothetical protein